MSRSQATTPPQSPSAHAHIAALVCPETRQPLARTENALLSPTGKRYAILANGKVDFLGLATENFKSRRDAIDSLKALVKNVVGRYYVLIMHLLSPVFPRMHWPTLELKWNYLVRKYTGHLPLVVQIGSGNHRLNNTIVNVDIFDFPEVDVMADCTKLPYADNSVDAVLSMAVVEHVEQVDLYVKEVYRVLKPGGVVLCGAPFIYGFHASPHDYQRWTGEGLKVFHQHAGFNTLEIMPFGGPTSSLIIVLQEWLAMLLSFNIRPLYFAWLLLWSFLLIPLKIIDMLLIYHSFAGNIASSFVYVGKK